MTTITSPTHTTTGTRFATSADGTQIAYEARGTGPALVIVEGALCHRTMGVSAALTEALEDRFTVFAYDRRGRGESGAGATPWSLEREIEDLEAVIDAAGGHAHAFGASSGGALCLEAARRGVAIDRLAVYELPFIVDGTHAPNPIDLPQRIAGMVDRGQRGEPVKTFMRVVGVPAPFIGPMRDAGVEEDDRRRAHAAVRPFHRDRPPTGRAAGGRLLRRRRAGDARDRGRQEPRVHAQRTGGNRHGRTPRQAGDACRTDAHGQGEGHRARGR